MSSEIRGVKGTRDLLPPETAVWQRVEATARRVFGGYGYGEIRTPAIEPTELFVRGVGESTDIVGKQMFTFDDRKGRSLTLRPESTAPVARAVLQHGLANGPLPVKLFYIGPHYRYERPQKGRYREFRQIGAELIGDPGPHSDAEVIAMLMRFLRELGFSDLVVLLNTVGDEESRVAFRTALVDYLTPHREKLSDDSRRRLTTNPLRILDTKSKAEKALLEGAPELDGFLTEASRSHFDELRGLLRRLGVANRREPRLVRGLDYYTRTVFEIVSEGLGAQDAIVGGGRYDGLIGELGGSDLPGIGFAIGEDRLIDVLPAQAPARVEPHAPDFVIPVGEVGPGGALELSEELRRSGIRVVSELGDRTVGAALKQAARSGARHALLLGDEELAAGEVTVKRLTTGEQERIKRDEVVQWLTAEE